MGPSAESRKGWVGLFSPTGQILQKLLMAIYEGVSNKERYFISYVWECKRWIHHWRDVLLSQASEDTEKWIGASTKAKYTKFPLMVLTSHIMSWLLNFQSSTLLMAWLAKMTKQQRWPKHLGLCMQTGDLEEAPGCCFQPSPALAIVAIWGVNRQIENYALHVFFPEFFQDK